jgi:hypothetical protein
VYLVLLFTAIESAFSIGICCADDESAASMAKNLAFGYGYSVSVYWDGSPGIFVFPWGTASKGPTLIIPAAALIKIFGNLPWVPGLATVLEIAILLFILASIHARTASIVSAAGYMLLFGLFCFAFTSGWLFITWYALLGEMPAALLIVLGATLWLDNPKDGTTGGLSGICFGLAFLAKYVSLLGALPMAAWLAIDLFREGNDRRRKVRLVLITAACFFIPIITFELWKITTLGPAAYVEVWREIFQFVVSQGTSVSLLQDPIAHISGQLTFFQESWHQSPLLILMLVLGGGIVAWQSAEARRLYAYFASAALLHWIWWVFVSPPGWDRYMLPGLVYQAAAFASLAYAVRAQRVIATIAIILLVGLHYTDPVASTRPIQRSIANHFKESPELAHLREAAEFLRNLSGQHTFVTADWITSVGLEYMLPTVGNFIRFDHISPQAQGSTPLYVVLVARWRLPKPPGFSDWERLCGDIVFDKKPVWIARCP